MTFLKKLFDFYINASIHVALSVYCLVRVTELYFDLPYNESLNYFIFYGTITGYNFVKYANLVKLNHRNLARNLKLIKVFSFICFGFTIFYASKLQFKTLLFFIPFGVLTLFYAVPFFTKSLRNISSLKILIIALVWAGVTVLLPLLDAVIFNFSRNQILVFIQRFLFVITITLPFDIRDLEFDNKNLQTIPQKMGVEKTKKIGFILLAICLLIEFFITPNANFRMIFLMVFLITLFLLMRAKTNQPKYYSSFWVEAIPIFWFIFLIFST